MKLRFLHLSDLHFKAGAADPATVFAQDVVSTSLVKAVAAIAKEGPLDFVAVTGDVAFSGKASEYRVAEVFFERLSDATGLPKERFYVVPGNHDVDRAHVSSAHRRICGFSTQEEIAETLADPGVFPLLRKKLEAFYAFANEVMGRRLFDDDTWHFSDVLRLDRGGRELRVSLLGLNSALFAGYDGDDQKKLALGLPQVTKALGQKDTEAPVSVALFHHPFECWHPEDEVSRRKLHFEVDVILQGHLHRDDARVVHEAAGIATYLSAGAAFERRDHENGFHVVDVDLGTGGTEVCFFKYLPGHDLWRETQDRVPRERDGRFRFVLPKVEKAPWSATANPVARPPAPVAARRRRAGARTQGEPPQTTRRHMIHDHLVPDHFTAREEELSRLEALAKGDVDPATGKTPGVIVLRAPGGVGKSCLARRHFESVGALGRWEDAVWFSFYGARTEDPTHVFRELLQRLDPASTHPEPGPGEAKGLLRRLLEVVDRRRVFFVLDGLEVIQHTSEARAAERGAIRDENAYVRTLLAHLANQKHSQAIVTTRVPLADLQGTAGHLDVRLGTFTETDGARYLERMGVEGTDEERRRVVALMGGHALGLRGAARWLVSRRVPASEIARLVEDPDRFRSLPEAEKVARIVDAYRSDLSPEQDRFLRLLAIHTRPVSERHFSFLVEGYGREGRDEVWVKESILAPLEFLGLLDVLCEDGRVTYHAHPLMKLAFSRWLAGDEATRTAHVEWARAALDRPDLSPAGTATCVADLEPYLEAVEHYQEAGDWDEAWRVFSGVARRLLELGAVKRLYTLAMAFHGAEEREAWTGSDIRREVDLARILDLASTALALPDQEIRHSARGVVAARRSRDTSLLTTLLLHHARTHLHMGRLEEARALLREADQQGYVTPWIEHMSRIVYGQAALLEGRFGDAVDLLERYVEEVIDNRGRGVALTLLARAALCDGRPEQAEQAIDACRAEAEVHGDRSLMREVLRIRTELDLVRGNLLDALAHEATREEFERDMQLPPFEPYPWLLLAERKFDAAIAVAAPRTSTPGDERLNKPREIEAHIVLARAWHGKGESERAREHFERARQLMEETGVYRDRPWFEEAERILSAST